MVRTSFASAGLLLLVTACGDAASTTSTTEGAATGSALRFCTDFQYLTISAVPDGSGTDAGDGAALVWNAGQTARVDLQVTNESDHEIAGYPGIQIDANPAVLTVLDGVGIDGGPADIYLTSFQLQPKQSQHLSIPVAVSNDAVPGTTVDVSAAVTVARNHCPATDGSPPQNPSTSFDATIGSAAAGSP